MKPYDKKIVLENGKEFYGYGFGASVSRVNELVFDTAMVGYQELLTDPSYTDEMVCMTYPLIGNYGMTDEDDETKVPTMGGLIVREYNDRPSNFRYTKTLSEVMEEYGIPGISGVDTRMITKIIRDEGTQKVLICDASLPFAQAYQLLINYEIPRNPVARVSSRKRWYARTPHHRFDVVAIDCGIKLNSIRKLNEKGCNVTIVPYNTSAADILKMRPDGLLLSNGPGDPRDLEPVIQVVRDLKGKLPMFGICLGHLVISLAMGANVYKMKAGHRGGNHPVRNLETGKLEITAQGHSYAVDGASLEGTGLTVTHVNVLDGTVEGVESRENKLFSVQFHPEAAPGPQDSTYLFDKFITLMEEEKRNAETY